MKRLLSLLLSIIVFFQFASPLRAADTKPSMIEAQKEANAFYKENFGSAFFIKNAFPDSNIDGYILDPVVYGKYDLLAYNNNGDIKGISGQQFHPTSNEPKYLGYSTNGNYIYNPDYDVTTTVTQNFDQIKEWDIPTDVSSTSPHLVNIDVNNNINRQEIKDFVRPQFDIGMETIESAIKDKLSPYWKDVEWEKYYTILSLPTRTTDGRVILTHTNGQYFMTVRLAFYDELPTSSTGTTTPETLPIGTMTGAAIIGHNEYGKEIFDTTKGIPTGEKLYVSVQTPKYIAEVATQQVSGSYTYYTNEPDGFNLNGTLKYRQVSHSIPYSYYMVADYAVYGLDYAETSNYALPSGKVKLTPKGYTAPTVVYHASGGYTYSGGGTLSVSSDYLSIDGQVILNGSASAVPATLTIPVTERTVLYETGLSINKTLLNKAGNTSATTVFYQYQGSKTGSPLPGKTLDQATNSVTVHTPVVCDASVRSRDDYNQEISPDQSRAALILGLSSVIRFPTSGGHLNIPGYGNRDYASYMSSKEVRFPFDVYIKNAGTGKTSFYNANTWVSIPVNEESVEFNVPTWVIEGNYNIDYRTTAINAPGNPGAESLANLNLANTRSVDSSPVRVIGRLYGFRITDIEDYPLWEKVFRKGEGSLIGTGLAYTVGLFNQNSQSNGNTDQYTLPIMNGSHPELQNEGGIKKGYTFKFELDSIGNYSGNKDCIEIKPRFYYVSLDGKTKTEIDLYYSENFSGMMNYFVKVGSDQDLNNAKYISLCDADRNVPSTEVKNTASLLGITEGAFREMEGKLGWFNRLILAKPLRTFTGEGTNLPTGVDLSTAMKSKQHWYGEYYLPDLTYAVPRGYDVVGAAKKKGLSGEEDFWLREGYIVVNFDIVTVKDADFDHPVLSYGNSPGADMWEIEGFQMLQTDSLGQSFSFNKGDIVLYYTDKKSSDDYSGHGTH